MHNLDQIKSKSRLLLQNAALSSFSGEAKLNMHSEVTHNKKQQYNSLLSDLHTNKAELKFHQKVRTITIDDLLEDASKDKPVFISLEINGGEPNALLGAKKLLESERPFFLRAGWRYHNTEAEYYKEI